MEKLFTLIREYPDATCFGIFTSIEKAEAYLKSFEEDPIEESTIWKDINNEIYCKELYVPSDELWTKYVIEHHKVDEEPDP